MQLVCPVFTTPVCGSSERLTSLAISFASICNEKCRAARRKKNAEAKVTRSRIGRTIAAST
jgi:hypothetical protein